VAQPAFDVFDAKFTVLENFRISFELDVRSVRFRRLAFVFLLELALLEVGFSEFTFAMTAHKEHL
jgi:hypothetical protein